MNNYTPGCDELLKGKLMTEAIETVVIALAIVMAGPDSTAAGVVTAAGTVVTAVSLVMAASGSTAAGVVTAAGTVVTAVSLVMAASGSTAAGGVTAAGTAGMEVANNSCEGIADNSWSPAAELPTKSVGIMSPKVSSDENDTASSGRDDLLATT
jgi:hypothetical protein